MSNLLAPGPLMDDELDELDRHLLALEGLDDAMDISMLDGFFTAIVCGPRTIVPSEWMRWVWDLENGRQAPEFENRAQAERVLGLILRHMNDVATVLNESPAEYEPLVMENPNGGDPVPIIDEWCVGFVKGMSLDAAGWSRLPASQRASLADIELYGTESRWNELEEKKLPLERHRAIAHGLAAVVRGVHAHFLKERRSRIEAGEVHAPARAEPIRNPGKVGRNEPCPCGSGKKYKRCHGTGMH